MLLAVSATCQTNSNKTYLNRYCKPVPESEAVYYRIIEKSSDQYIIRDYYVSNDSLEMEAYGKQIEPKVIYEGKAVWYHENGRIKKEGVFKEGEEIGMFNFYYKDGLKQKEVLYTDKKMLICQYWTEDGTPSVVNGSGVINTRDDDLYLADHNEVLDSLITMSFSVREDVGDSIYLKAEQAAEYKGGMKKLYEEVAKNLHGKYPAEARRHGVDGRVFIEFIVDKNGLLTEPKVLRGIGYGCDEAALHAMSQLKKWNPAKHKGKPVKSKIVLPVVFKLN